MYSVFRDPQNPLLGPKKGDQWRSRALFNPSVIKVDDVLYMYQRAEGQVDHATHDDRVVSTIGLSTSTDNGVTWSEPKQVIAPTTEFDKFGCEDPRATYFEGKFYVFYTALSVYPFEAAGIKVAVAISEDGVHFEERHLITPFNAKAMMLFPERVNGKVCVLLSANTDLPPAYIAVRSCDEISDLWNEKAWQVWYDEVDKHSLDLLRNQADHVETGAVPLKTEHGWLFVHSYIFNYFDEANRVFGIEAILLDINDPTVILARTNDPLLVPETTYEKYGVVPNICFPSGSLIDNNQLKIYYGGADTVCCRASVSLSTLFAELLPKHETVKRLSKTPILSPRLGVNWEAEGVFNPAAFELDDIIQILYRAQSDDGTNYVGLATSKDGVSIDSRLDEPIYWPRIDHEQKKVSERGNSGCEDPRVTVINDRLYMLYTAYDQTLPRVAITSISLTDFRDHKWDRWKLPVIISPDGVDDKDACILPTAYSEGYFVMHRLKGHLCADWLPDPEKPVALDSCFHILGPRPGMWDGAKVGIAGPPIEVDEGWLLFYHGVSREAVYSVGVALLDRHNPQNVLARGVSPVLTPELPWEKEGVVNNVVFPCSAVKRGNRVLLYYGGADYVVGVAQIQISPLLKSLLPL